MKVKIKRLLIIKYLFQINLSEVYLSVTSADKNIIIYIIIKVNDFKIL